MSEVEEYKTELANELHCNDHYGESCDGDCKGCLKTTTDCLAEFENLVRADERAKVIKEVCEKIIPLAKCRKDCKAMEKECVHCMMVKLDKIEEELEQLKEQKNETL